MIGNLEYLQDISAKIAALSILISLSILPILSIFKKSRRIAAVGFIVSSYLVGFYLWIYSIELVYGVLGGWVVFLCLFIFGVGTLPVAIGICLWYGQWGIAFGFCATFAVIWALRAFGFWMSQKAAYS